MLTIVHGGLAEFPLASQGIGQAVCFYLKPPQLVLSTLENNHDLQENFDGMARKLHNATFVSVFKSDDLRSDHAAEEAAQK